MLRASLLALGSVHGAAGLHLVFGGHCIPHPQKVDKGGEDAFFFDDRLGIFGVGGEYDVVDGVEGGESDRESTART